jgi:hypothetical protein
MAHIVEAIVKQGRLIFAIALIAFGVQYFVWARSAGPAFPVIPFVPAIPWLAYFTGAALLAAGICIAANIRARVAAILFGILFLLCDISGGSWIIAWRATQRRSQNKIGSQIHPC